MDVKWLKSVVEQYSLPLLINVCHFDVIWCIEFNFPLGGGGGYQQENKT
jgi:hypothetical protein